MYSSNEFLHSAGVSRHMQATGETPSQKTSMKRRSCEVPLGDISTNNFKVSLGDITNENNYDCRSLRSIQSEDTRSLRSYRPIDSRSVKNFRSSLVDVSGVSTFSLSRPPSYDQLSRRSFIEGAEGQGITSSIEGVLWSDEEENEYFYHENITSAWNEDHSSVTVNTRHRLFLVPADPVRARIWLTAINRKDAISVPGRKTKVLRLCQLHFEDRFLVYKNKKGKMVLPKDAVPTLNLPEPRSFLIKKIGDNVFAVPDRSLKLIHTSPDVLEIPPDPNFTLNVASNVDDDLDSKEYVSTQSSQTMASEISRQDTLTATMTEQAMIVSEADIIALLKKGREAKENPHDLVVDSLPKKGKPNEEVLTVKCENEEVIVIKEEMEINEHTHTPTATMTEQAMIVSEADVIELLKNHREVKENPQDLVVDSLPKKRKPNEEVLLTVKCEDEEVIDIKEEIEINEHEFSF